MNCDDVFDVLTRGPFPSGAASDQQVEDHLADCESCRRLAVALQPAIDLLREAIASDENGGLPAYTGRIGVPISRQELGDGWERAADESIELSAREHTSRREPQAALERARRPQNQSRRWPRKPLASSAARAAEVHTNLFRFAAAVLLGVAAAAGGRELVAPRTTPAELASPPVVERAARTFTGRVDRQALAALDLPSACAPEQVAISGDREANIDQSQPMQLALASAVREECCTECHSWSKGGLVSVERRGTLARACVACHQ